ncbi:MAG: bis-aminopropyl spermidine synthase family protein [Streptosporangiaceae bacterium]|jgi:predicted methyltransferase
MDMDAVIAEVAAAVGLAEGESGIRDILGALLRAEPAAVREVSRLAELPVPIVAAACGELRKRGVIDNLRPLRLTADGRRAVTAGQPDLAERCPACAGLGVRIPPELAELTHELERAAAGAPAARLELDQAHCTVATKLRRVLRLHAAHALAGQRIILLGDDDLVSVAIAAFAAWSGDPAAIRRLTVIDADPDVLAWAGEQAAGTGVAVELVQHDLRKPLPDELAGGFDVALTDPPYTVAGAELFLSRAVSALAPEPGRHVFFSFGARKPQETVAVQQAMASMGLAIRSLTPGFNEYLGAGILAGTSHLYHLRTAAGAHPAITGSYEGPLYTADGRAAVTRPYRCAACRAVHAVGPGARWPRIAALRAEGCPDCGAAVFRPMPLQGR